jgi:hypothetical protein
MKRPRLVYAMKRDRDGTLYRKALGPGAPWVPFDEIPGKAEVVKLPAPTLVAENEIYQQNIMRDEMRAICR